jgi:carboxylesterase
VLVLHAFAGTPQAVRGLAGALAGDGLAVELPCLPGHGSDVEALAATTWADWLAATEASYRTLAARCGPVVVVGLSTGAALAAALAAHHPELAGLVGVNPAVEPCDDALLEGLRARLDAGETTMGPLGTDVADPAASPVCCPRTPLASLVSLHEAVRDLAPRLGDIVCPALVMTSTTDHEVRTSASDYLAGALAGPVERLPLPRSFHVATLDHDRHLVEAHTRAFVRKVTAG